MMVSTQEVFCPHCGKPIIIYRWDTKRQCWTREAKLVMMKRDE